MRKTTGMIFGQDVKLQDQRCPHCETLLDGATAIGEDAEPSTGDVTICIYCGEILRFDDKMRLVKCPAESFASLTAEQRSNLDMVSLAIKARRSGANLNEGARGQS